jgi:NADPH-dependent 2,4-dienoyl-CoA reductase/sulfur reductase-like enzyme
MRTRDVAKAPRIERLLVIGGLAAGMSAASSAKRLRPEMDVIVLEKSPFISYGTCSIPYYISEEIKDYRDLIAITPEKAETERGLVIRTRHEVIAIDPGGKEVVVRSPDNAGDTKIPFDKLVIATGAVPIKPPLPGIGLKHIFALRTLEDGVAIKKYIDEHTIQETGAGSEESAYAKSAHGNGRDQLKAVIVGGGYIGLEMCESIRKRGVDVTLIERMDRVLGTMDRSVTEIVEETLKREAVRLFKETTVLGFEGPKGAVSKVLTDKGTFQADFVILAVGVLPESTLAQKTGIALGVNKAITVDEQMRTNVPAIFAAGDCADALSIVTGKKVYIPLGTTANKQGRVAGENAAGRETVFEGVAGTAQTKVFDLEVARTGLTSLEAERENIPYFASTIQGTSRAKSYPAGKPITITYVVEKDTGRLLGAQMVGQEGVAHRIDTLATALYGRMTVDDVARLDLGYAPPFATVWDPILIAANVALKKMGKR